ncbi:MAG: MDR family MFS transporter [Hyphomicrobiales bacterium]
MAGRLQYKYLVAIVFIFGLFMDLMDTTIVNVAVPKLTEDFHTTTTAVEWTVTGYLLSLAVFIPAAGYLSDRFGTKRAFLTAMAIFITASAMCGLAQSLHQLVFFRVLQGVGGGMMTPVGTAMLSREFPGAERAKASAIMSVPVVFAPTLGPVIGGYLIEYISWRWIFYINLPIGITGFIFALRVLREHKEPYAREGFDFVGLVLGGVGAASLLYALSIASHDGWTSQPVLTWGLIGLALIAAFVVVELRAHPPIIDLTLLKRPFFLLGNLMVLPAFGVFAGFLFMLTLFLQEFQGRSPLEAGLIQAPSSLGTAISLPLASRLYPRLGPQRMLLIGFSLAALTFTPFLRLHADTGAPYIIMALFFRGLPFAFAMVAAQTIIFGPIENAKQGPASSLYNTLRQVSASFGVALIATVLINRTQAHEHAAMAHQHLTGAIPPNIARHAAELGYHDAFLVCIGFMILPLLLSLFVNDRKTNDALAARVRMGETTGGHAAAEA